MTEQDIINQYFIDNQDMIEEFPIPEEKPKKKKKKK